MSSPATPDGRQRTGGPAAELGCGGCTLRPPEGPLRGRELEIKSRVPQPDGDRLSFDRKSFPQRQGLEVGKGKGHCTCAGWGGEVAHSGATGQVDIMLGLTVCHSLTTPWPLDITDTMLNISMSERVAGDCVGNVV